MTAASGLLLLDKPSGWTSHDCVAIARRRFAKGTKVGHCGTLDPMATGLLMILVGAATRKQQELQGLDKVYSGAIRLGVMTDTGDATGKVVEEKPVPSLSLAQVQAAMNAHVGRLEMAAPAYSAVKHEGKKLYEYARAGLVVPVKPRVCTVHEFRAVSLEGAEAGYLIRCTSGTYVRSLAEALGRTLGCGGTVSALRRESVDRFDVKDAITMDQLKNDELRLRSL
jgi:tRNA pseudouridine55 synthase